MMSRFRWAFAPLAIYVAARIFSAVVIIVAARHQVILQESIPGFHFVGSDGDGRPGYFDVVTNWDGQWYREIVEHGYPDSVTDASGQPIQTAVAFYPLYPLLVWSLMQVTGLSYSVAASSLSLIIGAVAVVLIHRLVERTLDRRRAVIVTLLLSVYPAAPILQSAYTESLGLL